MNISKLSFLLNVIFLTFMHKMCGVAFLELWKNAQALLKQKLHLKATYTQSYLLLVNNSLVHHSAAKTVLYFKNNDEGSMRFPMQTKLLTKGPKQCVLGLDYQLIFTQGHRLPFQRQQHKLRHVLGTSFQPHNIDLFPRATELRLAKHEVQCVRDNTTLFKLCVNLVCMLLNQVHIYHRFDYCYVV